MRYQNFLILSAKKIVKTLLYNADGKIVAVFGKRR